MWVRLKKHIGEGSIWYSLPSDDNEVKFVEGVTISYKLDGSEIEKKKLHLDMYLGKEQLMALNIIWNLSVHLLMVKTLLLN